MFFEFTWPQDDSLFKRDLASSAVRQALLIKVWQFLGVLVASKDDIAELRRRWKQDGFGNLLDAFDDGYLAARPKSPRDFAVAPIDLELALDGLTGKILHKDARDVADRLRGGLHAISRVADHVWLIDRYLVQDEDSCLERTQAALRALASLDIVEVRIPVFLRGEVKNDQPKHSQLFRDMESATLKVEAALKGVHERKFRVKLFGLKGCRVWHQMHDRYLAFVGQAEGNTNVIPTWCLQIGNGVSSLTPILAKGRPGTPTTMGVVDGGDFREHILRCMGPLSDLVTAEIP